MLFGTLDLSELSPRLFVNSMDGNKRRFCGFVLWTCPCVSSTAGEPLAFSEVLCKTNGTVPFMGDENTQPVIGPFLYGFPDQNKMIRHFEEAGWAFIHWTDVPRPGLAVMMNEAGEAVFIDDYGKARRGRTCTDAEP